MHRFIQVDKPVIILCLMMSLCCCLGATQSRGLCPLHGKSRLPVELPASRGEVTWVRRLSEGEDATPAVIASVERVKDGGILRFEKGVYHLHPESAHSIRQGISNNGNAEERRVAVLLKGLSDVTVDGNGSTVVCHGCATPFMALGCTNIVLKGFTVTADVPAGIEFVVTAKDAQGFEATFAEEAAKVVVDRGALTLSTPWGDSWQPIAAMISLDSHLVYYLAAEWVDAKTCAELAVPFVRSRPLQKSVRHIRFDYVKNNEPKNIPCPYQVGERLCFNLCKRDRFMLFAEDCNGVVVEDVTLRRLVGMGIVMQRTKDVTLRRYNVVPNPGEHITTGADAMMFTACCGDILLEECEISHSLDDGFNNHGNYLAVVAAEHRTVQLAFGAADHKEFLPYRAGDQVDFIREADRTIIGSAHVVSARLVAPKNAEITLDRDVTGLSEGLLVENVTLAPNLTIRKCHFHDYPNLRISQGGKILIEKNIMQRGMSALYVYDLAKYGWESGRVKDLTFRDNVVEEFGTPIHIGVSGWDETDQSAPRVHGRIVIEGNVFRKLTGVPVKASGVRELISDCCVK